jgi:hypothetical protein
MVDGPFEVADAGDTATLGFVREQRGHDQGRCFAFAAFCGNLASDYL